MFQPEMDVGEIGWGGVDCIALAQDRDKWRALVNAVMNLRVLLNAGKFLSCCQPVASLVLLSSIELVS
jgi:hypothetical protein